MHVRLALWIGRADQVDHPPSLQSPSPPVPPRCAPLPTTNLASPLAPKSSAPPSSVPSRAPKPPFSSWIVMRGPSRGAGVDARLWRGVGENPWIRGDQCLVNVYYRLYSFFSAVQVAVNTMVSVRESINFLAFNYVWECMMNQRSEKSRFGAALHHPAREGAPTLYLHRHSGGGFSSQQNRNWAYGYRSIMINIWAFISRG